jgi:predicted O-linked N-acetylglucosamine transferase (SPINDLY family)
MEYSACHNDSIQCSASIKFGSRTCIACRISFASLCLASGRFFVDPVLAHHDNSRVQAICYADSHIADEMTKSLEASAHDWIVTAGQSDEALAERIRADGIDLPYMTEQPVYMPGNYVTIDPFSEAPEIEPVPSNTNVYVTFDCFNNLDKLNESVVEVWAKILATVPKGRLHLISFDLGDLEACDRIEALFAVHDIEKGRLFLSGKLPRTNLLKAYNSIDIAFDPFPYSGV